MFPISWIGPPALPCLLVTRISLVTQHLPITRPRLIPCNYPWIRHTAPSFPHHGVGASITAPLEDGHGLFLPIRGPPTMQTRAACLRGFPWGLPFARRMGKTPEVTLFSSQPHRQQGSPASPLPGPGAFLPLILSAAPLWGDHPSPCGQDIWKGIFPCGGAAFLLTPLYPQIFLETQKALISDQGSKSKSTKEKKKRNVSLLNHKVDEILVFFLQNENL